MRQYIMLGLIALFGWALPVWATVGGPETIQLLGIDQKDQNIYFLKFFHDETGRLPRLYSVHIESGAAPIEVRSLYADLKEDDDQADKKLDARIMALRRRLSPLDKQDPHNVRVKTSVIKTESEYMWTLSFVIEADQFKGSGIAAACFDPSVRILEWNRVPKAKVALAIISYKGVCPDEGGYEKQDVVMLKGK